MTTCLVYWKMCRIVYNSISWRRSAGKPGRFFVDTLTGADDQARADQGQAPQPNVDIFEKRTERGIGAQMSVKHAHLSDRFTQMILKYPHLSHLILKLFVRFVL